MRLDEEIGAFIKQWETPKVFKKTTTDSPSKKREHNHYTMGKMGYNPKLARLMNHDKPKTIKRR